MATISSFHFSEEAALDHDVWQVSALLYWHSHPQIYNNRKNHDNLKIWSGCSGCRRALAWSFSPFVSTSFGSPIWRAGTRSKRQPWLQLPTVPLCCLGRIKTIDVFLTICCSAIPLPSITSPGLAHLWLFFERIKSAGIPVCLFLINVQAQPCCVMCILCCVSVAISSSSNIFVSGIF